MATSARADGLSGCGFTSRAYGAWRSWARPSQAWCRSWFLALRWPIWSATRAAQHAFGLRSRAGRGHRGDGDAPGPCGAAAATSKVALRFARGSQLLDAIRLAINDSSVMRLWVSTFDGDVVFSDTNQTGGALSASDPAFVSAAAGGTEADLIDRNGSPDSIRVLRPIRPEANGQAVGVLSSTCLMRQSQPRWMRLPGERTGISRSAWALFTSYWPQCRGRAPDGCAGMLASGSRKRFTTR